MNKPHLLVNESFVSEIDSDAAHVVDLLSGHHEARDVLEDD